jgi:hypothetical protein
MKKIVRLTEADLMRIVKKVMVESRSVIKEQTYARGTDVSFIVNKIHRIEDLDTQSTQCQGVIIGLSEVDPKTKKTMGNKIYYYVTRNGAIASQTSVTQAKDVRVSNGNNTNGAEVSDYTTRKVLGSIALAAMRSHSCK